MVLHGSVKNHPCFRSSLSPLGIEAERLLASPRYHIGPLVVDSFCEVQWLELSQDGMAPPSEAGENQWFWSIFNEAVGNIRSTKKYVSQLMRGINDVLATLCKMVCDILFLLVSDVSSIK